MFGCIKFMTITVVKDTLKKEKERERGVLKHGPHVAPSYATTSRARIRGWEIGWPLSEPVISTVLCTVTQKTAMKMRKIQVRCHHLHAITIKNIDVSLRQMFQELRMRLPRDCYIHLYYWYHEELKCDMLQRSVVQRKGKKRIPLYRERGWERAIFNLTISVFFLSTKDADALHKNTHRNYSWNARLHKLSPRHQEESLSQAIYVRLSHFGDDPLVHPVWCHYVADLTAYFGPWLRTLCHREIAQSRKIVTENRSQF